jgi:hypothetical protein
VWAWLDLPYTAQDVINIQDIAIGGEAKDIATTRKTHPLTFENNRCKEWSKNS